MAKARTKANSTPKSGSQMSVRRAKARNAAKGKRPSKTRASKEQTKAARILALLEKPEGATLKAIMAATGWQAHSVRGFISGQLVKKMGLRVKSTRRDGERVYATKG